jgi:hypothetical protein
LTTDVKIRANVFVATPSYGGLVSTSYVQGLLDLYDTADRHGFGLSINFNSFDSLITRARNTMVAEYLADDRFTHLMWIDGDIGFKGSDVVRLLQADRPLVAGLYPLKTDGWPLRACRKHCRPVRRKQISRRASALTRLPRFPATWNRMKTVFSMSSTRRPGFMLIKREVFTALISRFPELRYNPGLVGRPEHNEGPISGHHYAFFDTMIDQQSKAYLSEDYTFCRRAGTIGIQPAIDMQSTLTHQGAAVYQGDLGRMLQVHRETQRANRAGA